MKSFMLVMTACFAFYAIAVEGISQDQ